MEKGKSMKKIAILATALSAALGLSACQSMPQDLSPDEMVRYGMKGSLLVHNQYNFDGKMMLKVNEAAVEKAVIGQEKKMAEAEAYYAAEDDDTEEAIAAVERKPYEIIETRETELASDDDGDLYEELSYRDSYLIKAFSYPVGQDFAKQSYIGFSGAVDLRRGKMEMTPELNIQAAGMKSSANIPFAIDLKDMNITIGPSAIGEITLSGLTRGHYDQRKILKEAHNKYLRASLPESMHKKLFDKIPVKSLLRAIPEALDSGYAAVDKSAFKALPMDDFGRASGATHRIRLFLSSKEIAQINQVFSVELVNELKRLQGEQLDSITDEEYQVFVSYISDLIQKNALLTTSLLSSGMFDLPTVYDDVYLDRRGRVVAMQQVVPLESLSGKDDAISVVTQVKMNNFGRPAFKIKPKAAQIYNVNPLIEEQFTSHLGSDDDSDDADDMIELDAAAVVAED